MEFQKVHSKMRDPELVMYGNLREGMITPCCNICHSPDHVKESGFRYNEIQWYCGRCDNWFYTSLKDNTAGG
jgi:transposase-like protein